MEKIYSKQKNRELPVGSLFLGGFLVGTVLPNLIWKFQWRQKTMASFYFLRSFAGKEVSGWDYFAEVLRVRGGIFLLLFLCGFTIFGVPLAVAAVLLTGLQLGVILTMAVLEFGPGGAIAGLSLVMPQYLVYFPVLYFLSGYVYGQSRNIWKNYGILPSGTGKYVISCCLVFAAGLVGVMLETWVNPWLVEKTVKILKFF